MLVYHEEMKWPFPACFSFCKFPFCSFDPGRMKRLTSPSCSSVLSCCCCRNRHCRWCYYLLRWCCYCRRYIPSERFQQSFQAGKRRTCSLNLLVRLHRRRLNLSQVKQWVTCLACVLLSLLQCDTDNVILTMWYWLWVLLSIEREMTVKEVKVERQNHQMLLIKFRFPKQEEERKMWDYFMTLVFCYSSSLWYLTASKLRLSMLLFFVSHLIPSHSPNVC